MTSNRSPATGSNRSPRSARTRTPFRRALSRAVRTARREMSTAVTSRAPRRAAATASAPLPVHRSSTEARGATVASRSHSASIHVSLSGRKTPGGTSSRTRRFISSPALPQTNASAPDADQLRAIFDAPGPLTVGVEDELMLLDPESLALVTRAPDVLAAVGEDPRFKLELPASQLEIVLPPLDG